jgi:hypothetical protein
MLNIIVNRLTTPATVKFNDKNRTEPRETGSSPIVVTRKMQLYRNQRSCLPPRSTIRFEPARCLATSDPKNARTGIIEGGVK